MEKKIPKLRFPEFDGEWVEKKLGELCKMQAGKFVNATEIKNELDIDLYPCYGGNGLRGYTKSFNQIGKYTLIGRQGAHCGNVTLVNGKFYATEHAVVVSLKQDLDTDLIYYILGNLNLNQYSTGLAQPGLSVQNLEKIDAIIPQTLPEQTKIANFLSAVDDKITQLKKKKELLEQYKKGVMQKIFSQELRFKDENGEDFAEWEEKKLGEVLKIQGGFAFKSEKFKIGKTKVFRIGDIVPRIKIKEFSGVYSSELPDDKYIVRNNDFLMALSGATFGKVGKIIDNGEGYINQRVATFRTNQCLEFFYQQVQTENFKNYINSIPSASAQPNISNDDIGNYSTYIPSLPEQTKIANFLSAIDDKINHSGNQIEKMEAWKKGLLQQLFV